MSSRRTPTLRLEITSGALAGQVFDLPLAKAVLGRSAGCDVRLDPHEDRQVSGRHAELTPTDGEWTIRDLASLNGTFLNGRRVEQDTAIGHGDVIRLGPEGPRLRAVLSPTALEAFTEATELSPKAARAPRPTTRLGARLAMPGPRFAAALVLASLLAATAVLWARSERQRLGWERERAALLLRLQDAAAANTQTTTQFEGQVDGLVDSLQRSTATVTELMGELERATRDAGSEQLRGLQGRLEELLAEQAELRLAASLDWPAIRAATEAALARVYVERVDGRIEAGTAFSVDEPGRMVTAAHLVAGPDGTGRPRRIAVQPAATRDVLPAELVALNTAEDLAVLRLSGQVGIMAHMELNARLDSVQPGQAIALMGFPLQLAASGDSSPPMARPLASAGILRRITDDRVELSGFGARGASGSPVMDANGSVLGLLRGSIERNGEQILIAVPATKIIALLGAQPE